MFLNLEQQAAELAWAAYSAVRAAAADLPNTAEGEDEAERIARSVVYAQGAASADAGIEAGVAGWAWIKITAWDALAALRKMSSWADSDLALEALGVPSIRSRLAALMLADRRHGKSTGTG